MRIPNTAGTRDPGLERHQCNRIGFGRGLNDLQRKDLNGILLAVYRLFIDKDLSLVDPLSGAPTSGSANRVMRS